ncbi:MAG: hypothetical protein J5715_01055 [Clostridiales bacterium]|nr:hypothetical protein [Clostridiales bacterium]MBO4578716.1 hypothetical protein [Clostridiales bacterium]
MATIQGMCKNCGSLIVFDNRDDKCECVFCHLVFPAEEAVKILENPGDYTFPNEKIEETDETRHYYATPVYPDMVEKAVARDKTSSKKDDSDSKLKPNEFEVQAKDVKAPKSLVIGLIIGITAAVAIVVAIALPMYLSRTELKNKITTSIGQVFEGTIKVDTSVSDDGYSKGYSVFGQTCQNIKVATTDDVTQEKAKEVFSKYCDLRNRSGNFTSDADSKVTLELYTPKGIYTVTNASAEFKEDEFFETKATTTEQG